MTIYSHKNGFSSESKRGNRSVVSAFESSTSYGFLKMKLLHFPAYLALLSSAVFLVTYIHVTWLCQYYWAQFTSTTPANGTTYDFIVVGSGSAGSPVAGRLGEAGYKVLLIEAGGPSHWMQGIPGYPSLFMRSPYAWKTVVPSKEMAKGHQDNVVGHPRGRVLGGGSMLNWMAYMRGHSGDYDEWEQMGNPGWGFKDVLRFFKKSEMFQGEFKDPGMEKYHARDGKVGVQYAAHHYPFNSMMDDLFREVDIPLGDLNGQEEDQAFFKAGQAQVTLTKSWRLGTYRSYVEPILGTVDIDVLTFAQATRVLFEGDRAVGVEYDRFGERHTARASKEVIVSSGAVGSPQLLMLSGIGPKNHLKEHGIPVIKDLPVGDNLHDHVLSYLFFTSNTTSLHKSPMEVINPWYIFQAAFLQGGPLTDTNIGTNGYFHTKINKDKKRPDMQLHTLPCLMDYDWKIGLVPAFFLNSDMFPKAYEDSYGAVFLPTILRPKSRGTVRLASANPFDEPLFDPGYMTHPDDVEVMVETMKYLLSFADTDTFKKYDLKPQIPGPEPCGQKPYSDEFLVCHAKSWANTVYHPVGTCKMGPDSDPTAVVDSRLRVRGLQGLRVIDASIMPTIVGSNTNAPSIMIGERGVDFVLQDWAWSGQARGQKKPDKRDEL